ncbi:ATP-binding protein [Prevotella sp. E13-17]|uniref:ATP-binding protein n=1 Tax=Prevotella sp. E13-17 TaxID=2913616 RepID=UPI001EDB8B6B|nr:ATP-binding protein [Prevotella sp. E13-17]UKK52097.1 ATP-binding protein [Prevotella sp. E13-17]
MNNFLKKSFSARISLSLLILAMPLFLASVGVLFIQTRRIVRQQSVERANSTLYTTMQLLKRYLITAETATNANSWLVEESLNHDSLMAFSQRIVWMNPYLSGCSITMEPDAMDTTTKPYSVYTGRNGEQLQTVIGKECEQVDAIKYKIPRYLKKPCWEVYYNKADTLTYTLDGMVASYHKPLYDTKNKRFAGIISTDLSMNLLSEKIAKVKPYPHSYFMILDEEGHYLIHPDSTRLMNKTIFSGKSADKDADIIALGHEMTKGVSGRMNIEIDGEPALVCYRPVPGTTWTLAVVCPDRDIMKGYKQLSHIVAALLFIGFVITLLACHRVAKRSIQPLKKMLKKVNEISKGNMEVHIGKSTRKDIVGELQNSYGKMLSSLNFYMGSVRYTTEQTAKRNKELEEATEKVKEADRQKTKFIQNMTHQVRTPLNIIMGFAQVLSNDANHTSPAITTEELRKIADTMYKNSKYLNRMMLMLFDSSDNGKKALKLSSNDEMVNPNKMCREIIAFVKETYLDVPIAFTTELPAMFYVRANTIKLKYSVAEMLLNAQRHSDRANISLSVKLVKDHVQFIVQDTGKGIAKADRQRIFKFFDKVDDFTEGLGLGLPLIKQHAEEMGGKVWLDDTYTEGCRFVLEMPL